MSEIVMVERVFDEAVTFEDVQAREHAVASCFLDHRVHALRSYLSLDRRQMLCVYRAADAESVRITQQQAGIPITRAWTAVVLGNVDTADAPAAGTTIVVERELPAPMTLAEVEVGFARQRTCFEIHRAELVVSHLARDGSRMCCVFAAPDAESVRIANRQAGMPMLRAWPATVHVAR